MSRKLGKAVPEGNGPVPYHDEFGSREPTMVDLYRMFEEKIDAINKNLGRMSEFTGMLRAINQHLAGQEHETRQPSLATEADVKPDTKTRKCAEGASAADRVMNGESFSAKVDYGPTSLTSVSMIAEPPTAKKPIGDALVNKGAEVLKPYLSPVEIHAPKASGGLMPAGTASTVLRTIFSQPLPSWILYDTTKKRTSRTNFNQLAPSS